MSSREAWRAIEGTELQDGVVLRELIEVVPSPIFRGESRSGAEVLVRFWGKDYGDLQTIIDRHREATFMDHPGMLRCMQSGLATSGENEYAYAVFEGPEGMLADSLQQGRLSPAEAQALGRDLVQPLEYLHNRDLVYCALDPWTVARKNGRWVLADYSQIRLSGTSYASETRRLLVSFQATPPEAYEGKVSPAWDSWGLAHLLRTSLLGTASRRKPGERSHSAPHVPEPFASVLSACTVMDPAQRCTVREIADRLQALPASEQALPSIGEVLAPPPVRAGEPPGSRVPNWKGLWVAAIFAGALVLLLVLFLFARQRLDRSAAAVSPPPAPARVRPNPLDLPVATEVEAMPARSRNATEAEIEELVGQWVNSYRSGDLDAHLSLYAPRLERFYLARNVSLRSVRRTKQRALRASGDVKEYEIGNMDVDLQTPTRATVSFDKTYEFSRGKANAGKVRSLLYLRKIDENWRIAGERDIHVYWQKKV